MRLRRTLISAIIAVAAVTVVAASSASRVAEMPTPMNQIAYFNFDARDSGFDVMLANTEGGGVMNLTHDGTAKMNVDPNWSTDGTKVAYSSYTGANSADIIVVDAYGKGYVNLTPATRKGILNTHPTWSPDGSIVFASNRDGNFDLYRIGTVKSLSSRLVRLTNTNAPTQNFEPDYSPDGSALVFSTTGRPIAVPDASIEVPTAIGVPTAMLAIMKSVPGASATMLTKVDGGLGDRGAAWSSNGKQIAFYSDRTGNNELYVMNGDGTGLFQVTSNKADDREPSWSPDGSALVFNSDRSSYTELWMTSLVGTSLHQPAAWEITFDKQLKGSPDWQPITWIGPNPRIK